jgi:hypothetical protein
MMMFRPRYARFHAVVLAAAFASGAAYAGTPGEPPPPAFGAATSADQLQAMTGGTDTHVNNLNTQETNGTVSNNSNFSLGNGANNLDGGAFGNSAGVNTVIQNTGNNVLIQNATIVHMTMQQ